MTDLSELVYVMSTYREDYELRVQPMMGNLDYLERYRNAYTGDEVLTWAKPSVYRLIKEGFEVMHTLEIRRAALERLIS